MYDYFHNQLHFSWRQFKDVLTNVTEVQSFLGLKSNFTAGAFCRQILLNSCKNEELNVHELCQKSFNQLQISLSTVQFWFMKVQEG